MAVPEHVAKLKEGVEAWNQWRQDYPQILPNLRKANLRGKDLQHANFNDANLRRADLREANLSRATLRRADLRRAVLSDARLNEADLTSATLIETDLRRAVLNGCRVYGIAAWNLELQGAKQQNLIIGKQHEAVLTVDDLEVAQFIYLLLNNHKIRDVISTIGQKAVLILGRFSPPERKAVLDGIAEKLRARGFLPMLFDFERSRERDFTETIRILAGLSLFVIADITNPKSAPLELQATVPDYKIPFAIILAEGEEAFSMFNDLNAYDWVLKPVITYPNRESLLAGLEQAVINPALQKHLDLVNRKAETLKTRSIGDILTELGRAADG